MSKFRKKSLTIEAVRYLPDGSNSDEIEAFVGGDGISWKTCNPMIGVLVVLGGEVDLMAGDWVIKGVQGEFYPCKPDIFERTYEEVLEFHASAVDAELIRKARDAGLAKLS